MHGFHDEFSAFHMEESERLTNAHNYSFPESLSFLMPWHEPPSPNSVLADLPLLCPNSQFFPALYDDPFMAPSFLADSTGLLADPLMDKRMALSSELKSLHKKNKRLCKKIEAALTFLSEADDKLFTPSAMTTAAVQVPATINNPSAPQGYGILCSFTATENDKFGPFVIDRSPTAENSKELMARGRLTSEELVSALESKKVAIFAELKEWPNTIATMSGNNKKLIETFEGYKKLARKYIRRVFYTDNEDKLSRLCAMLTQLNDLNASAVTDKTAVVSAPDPLLMEEKLGIANAQSDAALLEECTLLGGKLPYKQKVIAKSNGTADTNPELSEEKPGDMSKQKIKKKVWTGKNKSLWTQIEPYFYELSPEAENAFSALLSEESQSPAVKAQAAGLLNMFAVNRLSAIAKMLQYCKDNKLTTTEFMEDRTYQKIKSRYKQQCSSAIFGKLTFGTTTSHFHAENMSCPALDEIDYLLSIGKDRLDSTISYLKAVLVSPAESFSNYFRTLPVIEQEFSTISSKNRSIFKKISDKIKGKFLSSNAITEPILNASSVPPQNSKVTAEPDITSHDSLPATKSSEIIPIIKKRRKKTEFRETIKRQKIEDPSTETKATPKSTFQDDHNGALPMIPPPMIPSQPPPLAKQRKFQILRTVVPFPSTSQRRNTRPAMS